MRIQARISGQKMRRALRPARTPTCLNATPVSHMDVWPTTAAMVGLTPPHKGFTAAAMVDICVLRVLDSRFRA